MIREISRWSKKRKRVTFKAADWFTFQRGVSARIKGLQARIEEVETELYGTRVTRFRGGDCGSFCGTVCEDNGGCDFEFGEPPECGAACGDGSVKIQEEV